MADEKSKTQKHKKWLLAGFLLLVVVFMYVSVIYKIKTYGP